MEGVLRGEIENNIQYPKFVNKYLGFLSLFPSIQLSSPAQGALPQSIHAFLAQLDPDSLEDGACRNCVDFSLACFAAQLSVCLSCLVSILLIQSVQCNRFFA
jgi:hypothetical protein